MSDKEEPDERIVSTVNGKPMFDLPNPEWITWAKDEIVRLERVSEWANHDADCPSYFDGRGWHGHGNEPDCDCGLRAAERGEVEDDE